MRNSIHNQPGLLERRRELRRNATPAENTLWQQLRGRRFLDAKFYRQYGIGSYIADFYCHAHKLVIEVDGSIHETAEKIGNDEVRTGCLGAYGLNVLRFTNDQVINQLNRVLEEIAQALDVQ